jgi:Fe2+ or Zn2+ uptake regulation protein
MMNDQSISERQALAHAEENLINTNDHDGMLPAASCSHLVDSKCGVVVEGNLELRHITINELAHKGYNKPTVATTNLMGWCKKLFSSVISVR